MHDAVSRGSLAETQKTITEETKRKLAIAKDPCGTPLIHKAVYYDQPDIVAWLVENYPITPQQKDKVHQFLFIHTYFRYTQSFSLLIISTIK